MNETTSKKAGKTDSVRALTRGLAILRHINANGAARVGEIARALDIPRPTVYRLLETLEEAGYVALSPTSSLVRVTRLAAALGDGYAVTSELCQAAGPVFSAYAAKLVWPLDLSVHDNFSMVIQETTHNRSPLSIDRAMIGYRMPMLRTSAGRAYLAFCDDDERHHILEHLRRLGDPADLPFLQKAWLDRMLGETRASGIAVRDGGEFRPQTSSFAVPVLAPDRLLGCVSMIWIRSAMTTRDALELGQTPLTEIAGRIARALKGGD
ncbi:DNA-binding transcriptional regulator [Martelella soudanensis]|uniref:DNA-binding transcriptional regulator n=1 Tax=unclassified Martelella TaxID=2629616 RepID=UPI0015DE4783|nr:MULTISPECIES: DNA-binding transcriptional regulator [unclassified Martelella]